MITTVFLDLIYYFVLAITSIVSALGTVSADNNVTSGILSMKTYYTSLNDFLPIDVIVAIIAFDLLVEGAILSYKLIKWSYQKVPFIN